MKAVFKTRRYGFLVKVRNRSVQIGCKYFRLSQWKTVLAKVAKYELTKKPVRFTLNSTDYTIFQGGMRRTGGGSLSGCTCPECTRVRSRAAEVTHSEIKKINKALGL